MKSIVALLPAEARVAPRPPPPRKLAGTYPHGYRGDPAKENRPPPGHRLSSTHPAWCQAPRTATHCAGRPRSVAGGAVDRLADQVGVAAVAGVLLDHVDEDPAQ